jgi:hypothetical protein
MKTKIFYLILFINTINITAFSQCEPLVVQRTIGGNLDDILRDGYATSDGGWILGGSSSSGISGEKTQNSRGGSDYWIVKLNRDLARRTYKQWDKTFGGSSFDILRTLQQTLDGGYILGGYSSSPISGEKTQSSRGGSDYWIVKLDNSGNKQWDKTIGGSGADTLISIQQTLDGGYILGGNSRSGISGEKTQSGRGGSDYWIVKLDNNGNKQWDKTIGGSGGDALTSLQQTSDGGYILGGYSSSNISGEKTENSRGGNDYWIVKLDNSGNKQWDKTIGGSGEDDLTSLQQVGDGGYILGGRSKSPISGQKTQNSRGGFDYWIVRLTRARQILWDKTIGGSSDDFLAALQQTRLASGYILGGYSFSNQSGEKTENSMGSHDYWIVMIDNTGIKQWDKTIGGSGDDVLMFIHQYQQHVFVAAGYSRSSNTGCKTGATRGLADYWIVAINDELIGGLSTSTAATDLSVAPMEKNKVFRVYPVPATNILHVQGNSNATYLLTNLAGKVLLTKNIAGNGTIDVSHLPGGMYYLKNNETGVIQKVVVSK